MDTSYLLSTVLGKQLSALIEVLLLFADLMGNIRCCHISPDSANGSRTDRKNVKMFFRLGVDEGRRGRCKERKKRMSNA